MRLTGPGKVPGAWVLPRGAALGLASVCQRPSGSWKHSCSRTQSRLLQSSAPALDWRKTEGLLQIELCPSRGQQQVLASASRPSSSKCSSEAMEGPGIHVESCTYQLPLLTKLFRLFV